MTLEELSLYLNSKCTDINKYEELINKRDNIRKQLTRSSNKYYDALDLINIFNDIDKTKESILKKIAKANKDITKFEQLKLEFSNINSEIDNLLST